MLLSNQPEFGKTQAPKTTNCNLKCGFCVSQYFMRLLPWLEVRMPVKSNILAY